MLKLSKHIALTYKLLFLRVVIKAVRYLFAEKEKSITFVQLLKNMKSQKIALTNGRICESGSARVISDVGIVIEGSRIVGVMPLANIPQDIQCVDMEGCIVASGFIDILANGAGGGAFGVSAIFDDLRLMAETMMAEGTTGFLAAAPSNTLPMYLQIQRELQAHQAELPVNFLGMHLEGPYFSMEHRGAHCADCVRDCTDEELKALLDKERHFVRMMSVAPERISDSQVLRLEEKGVRIAFAHSAASYDEALHFLAKPHRSVTHLYNGMPQMHHRKPGHIPAIFRCKPLTGIIVDGVHVCYEMVRMAYDMMHASHHHSLYLFTDRFTDWPAMGITYDAEHDYYVRATSDGENIICGSALSMIKAVRNSVEHVGIPMGTALEMASLVPAEVLGIDHLYGKLEGGYVANLVAFDEDWQVKRVMFEGEWVR